MLPVAELEFDDFSDDVDDDLLPSVRIVHRLEDTDVAAGGWWKLRAMLWGKT